MPITMELLALLDEEAKALLNNRNVSEQRKPYRTGSVLPALPDKKALNNKCAHSNENVPHESRM